MREWEESCLGSGQTPFSHKTQGNQASACYKDGVMQATHQEAALYKSPKLNGPLRKWRRFFFKRPATSLCSLSTSNVPTSVHILQLQPQTGKWHCACFWIELRVLHNAYGITRSLSTNQINLLPWLAPYWFWKGAQYLFEERQAACGTYSPHKRSRL